MAKLTDARVGTLQNFFDSGDQPTSAQFDQLIQWIQEGIEEHDHSGTGDGDGVNNLVGPVGIGCLPEADYILETFKNGGGAYFMKFFHDGGDGAHGIVVQCGEDTNPDEYFIVLRDGDGNSIGRIEGDGAGGVRLTNWSDPRAKNILEEMDTKDVLTNLAVVKPVRYTGIKPGGRELIGFDASQLAKYYPEVVSIDEETGYYMMDYARLTPILWAQNQALLKRIEQLEA